MVEGKVSTKMEGEGKCMKANLKFINLQCITGN